MTDIPKDQPITIELGGKTRTLEVTTRAVRLAQRMLGGKSPREALALNKDVDVIACCAAAALHKELEDKADPARVSRWIDRDRKVYTELQDKTVEAFRRYYVELGVIADDELDELEANKPPGEAEGS